jgi:hypothetical protein
MFKFISLFFFLVSSYVYAAPSIGSASGVFVDGNSIELNGSGFGNHDLDIEFLGGNDGAIENMGVGQGSSFGNWILGDGRDIDAPVQVIDDATIVRSGSKAWLFDMPLGGKYAGAARYDYGSPIPENTPIYISWWVRKDWGDETGQWKMFRLAYQNNIQDQGTEIVLSNWTNKNIAMVRPGDSYGEQAMTYYGQREDEFPVDNNTWYRMEVMVTTSTLGNKDGKMDIKIHDSSAGVIKNTSFGYSQDVDPKYPSIYTYNVSKRYQWFLWQNYRGNGMDHLKVWMDDMYVQVGTHKRIELCDSDVWAACTVREIQKPTRWDDSSISLNLNRGGFRDNSKQYYLYVVDENNSPSNAYPISFSGELKSPALPPSDITVELR